MKKAVFLFFYYLLNFTWGILQNIFGLIMLIKHRKCKREFYHGSVCTLHEGDWGGISLGIFIFVNGNRDEQWLKEVKVHEYGHSIQSMILGPLYLLIIGIPSFIWCNSKKFKKMRENGVSYFDFYPEKWANYLGSKVTKEQAPRY